MLVQTIRLSAFFFIRHWRVESIFFCGGAYKELDDIFVEFLSVDESASLITIGSH